MKQDNWPSHEQTHTCKFCMWFVNKNQTVLGRCRKRAPTLDGWPAVYESDWCGEHKMDGSHLDYKISRPAQTHQSIIGIDFQPRDPHL